MSKVIIFRGDLLPSSETFIKAQALALARWIPVLVGYRFVDTGLELNGLDIQLIPGVDTSKWQRRHLLLCQWMGVAHNPTVHTLRELNADLVHVHFGTDAVDVWPSVRKVGLPMLVTLHGYDININRQWWKDGHGGARRKLYPDRLLKLARESTVRFVAVSNAIRTRAIEFGIPGEKIALSYVGVAIDNFRPGSIPVSERRKRVLFVGRLVEKKGAEYLIRAFALTRRALPCAELILIGDGPLRQDLENLARLAGVPVIFLGSLPNAQIKEQMNQARVFCLPSVTAENGDAEGFGIVLLEAQACGVPVVSSAKGGATEGLVNGKTGFLFTEKDTVTLADKLSALLTDDRLASELSANAREFVCRNFSLSACTAIVEDNYDISYRTKSSRGTL